METNNFEYVIDFGCVYTFSTGQFRRSLFSLSLSIAIDF